MAMLLARGVAIDVAWAAVAFCLWVPLIEPARRLRLPAPVAVAAVAGWLAARLIVVATLARVR
jgi:hypothetical protein